MKKITSIITISSFLLSLSCFAQPQTHRGFFLSMGMGPAFGDIQAESNTGEKLTISGTAYAFDVMLGGTPKENLILHATIGIKSIFGPTISTATTSGRLNEEFSVDEFMMGVGFTQYLQNNFLISATIGSATFLFTENKTSYETDQGFSYQLKIGKEWWISPRWALGASIHYANTSLSNTYTGGVLEKWKSNRISILFQATLHGKRE